MGARKARCFIQVEGWMHGSHGGRIPVMKDWIAILPDPVDLVSVSAEALRFCQEKGINAGEIIHFQKLGTLETGD